MIRLISGTGLDDDVIGSPLAERIWGLGGKDRLYGRDGNDELYGGDGNDLLDGGTGRDLMFGGSGDDSYRVDNVGDFVSETLVTGQDDGGTDTVTSTISYSLGAFIEKLVLSGNAAINGSGNDLDNNIKGNDAGNVLFGAGGRDTINGYDGNDTLIGGAGRDYYTGGAGADTFVLKNEAGEWDRVYDFTAEDRFGIVASDFGLSEGAGLNGGVLDTDYFVSGTAATAAGHGQLIFNSAKSELLWDADGTGAAKVSRVALITTDTPLIASHFTAFGEAAATVASVTASEAGAREENGGPVYFTIGLSQPVHQDVVLTYRTLDGTATGGQDFVSVSSAQVLLKAGQMSVNVPVALIDDSLAEGTESFSVALQSAHFAGSGIALPVSAVQATGQIVDEGPSVVAEHNTAPLGMTDPSALAYNPFTNTLFMADSEVDEAPFFQAQNLFSVQLDGGLTSSVALPFTTEPTGLAYDASGGVLYITDDDLYRVFAVDGANPTQILWSFDTISLGGNDPEDIAVDTNTGNLFIVNGIDRTIIEVDSTGQTLIDSFVLAPEIIDPEALAFDSTENVFYVGGGFSANIWKLDRSGDVIDVITVLEDARSTDLNRRVNVKDIELAPASDGSGHTHLYVADYGWSHEADGRLIELDPGDGTDIWIA
ncbi:Calx-beta domain-containing protein [Puniceibacterium confluentis]|uniref:Calx-beta domain-containing protein n=1 Tax=Puniceibacterium confluentis TaxID=1958944 RepID=UPI0011B81093|nr:Calx-beta domain-containing protein [Puniceibacterium confluentis]